MVLPVLIRKEFTQFRRNPFMPKLLIALPLMVMFVMPWVNFFTEKLRAYEAGKAEKSKADGGSGK